MWQPRLRLLSLPRRARVEISSHHMNAIPRSDDCLRYIHCEMHASGAAGSISKETNPWRAVTISREAGSGVSR